MKSKFFRTVALVLVCVLLITALVGCKKDGDGEQTQSVVSTQDDNGKFVKDDLPATMDFGGRDVTFYICWQIKFIIIPTPIHDNPQAYLQTITEVMKLFSSYR